MIPEWKRVDLVDSVALFFFFELFNGRECTECITRRESFCKQIGPLISWRDHARWRQKNRVNPVNRMSRCERCYYVKRCKLLHVAVGGIVQMKSTKMGKGIRHVFVFLDLVKVRYAHNSTKWMGWSLIARGS